MSKLCVSQIKLICLSYQFEAYSLISACYNFYLKNNCISHIHSTCLYTHSRQDEKTCRKLLTCSLRLLICIWYMHLFTVSETKHWTAARWMRYLQMRLCVFQHLSLSGSTSIFWQLLVQSYLETLWYLYLTWPLTDIQQLKKKSFIWQIDNRKVKITNMTYLDCFD